MYNTTYVLNIQHSLITISRKSISYLVQGEIYYEAIGKDTNRKIRKCGVHRLYAKVFSSTDIYKLKCRENKKIAGLKSDGHVSCLIFDKLLIIYQMSNKKHVRQI